MNKIYGTNRQWMGRLTQSKLIGLHSHPGKVNNLKRKTVVYDVEASNDKCFFSTGSGENE